MYKTLSHARTRPPRRILLLTLLALTVFVIGAESGVPMPAFSQTREQTTRALLATVQIIMPDDTISDISLGSGTIMDDGGLILTNHHVVAGDAANGLMNEAGLAIIGMTPDDLRGEAVLRYVGEVVKIDPELDLALIQIKALFDETDAPLPATLGLTVIERGDSDELLIADTINISGYPGIGGNTLTLTRGLVSGFLDENRDGIYEWIKTDAVLSSGNSGGLATDSQGRFIGVPTAGRYAEVGQLGLVRSGALALDFVDSYFPDDATHMGLGTDAGGPGIVSVQFATAVARNNEPVNPALRFAPGVTDLYAVFQHRNFTNERPFTVIWRLDGAPLARDEFAWDGGAGGSNWVSINIHDGLTAGHLQLELLFDNVSVYRGGIMIGEEVAPELAQPSGGSFGPITFAQGIAGNTPVDAGVEFSALPMVYAIFNHTEMRPGTSWHTRWYLNDNQVLEQVEAWDAAANGVYYVTLFNRGVLPLGRYRLELYIGDGLVQQGEFRIVEATEQPPRTVGVVGTLRDRDNQRRLVSGAVIMVLTPGISPQSWLAAGMPGNQVIAKGISSRLGAFRLDTQLTVGTRYPLVIMHEQYRTVAVDDFLIPADAVDPYRLEVDLQRN